MIKKKNPLLLVHSPFLGVNCYSPEVYGLAKPHSG